MITRSGKRRWPWSRPRLLPDASRSPQKRKRVEEVFGWLKTVGLLRKVKLRGVRRVRWMFTFAAAVYNLGRMRNLLEATG